MDEERGVDERDGLVELFEAQRGRLRGVAYRLLGSLPDAEDAVQETWWRLARADTGDVERPAAWLTTVVSRVCLDMLRSRAARREEPLAQAGAGDRPDPRGGAEPEREALLAEEVGGALLVVLDRLTPAERVAFVLHEMFAVPFAEIAPIVDRSTDAAKQLASRARRAVRGTPAVPAAELAARRAVIDAFLRASRAGDIDAVLAVLAPDVVRRADPAALTAGRPVEVRGARAVAEEVAVFGRHARSAAFALVDGRPGIVVAPYGRLRMALAVAVDGDRITGYELIAAPERLRGLTLAVPDRADALR